MVGFATPRPKRQRFAAEYYVVRDPTIFELGYLASATVSSRRGECSFATISILRFCSSHPNHKWDASDGIVALALQR